MTDDAAVMFIAKTEVDAELFLDDGTAFAGMVYVRSPEELGNVHPMLDLLGGRERLIPCRGESGELVLIGRSSVSAVRVADESFDLPDRGGVNLPMKLTMAGGHRFDGTLQLPEAAGTRISDLLNYADPWLVQIGESRHVWVATDKLVRAEAP
ncbi:MAG: hypothetical protein OEM40_03875 [Acidimicrobiia bacterium]|nr:hypothetical protein [Acidimicrobiia bacterium]MDH5504137.1 hypothetical protein [Acidimicrobiia bacterium]